MKATSMMLAALTLAPLCAQAQTKTAQLDAVTVLGTRLEESLPLQLAEYGNRVETIDAGQIQRGGFADAAQALQMLAPGLYLTPKNGAFDYVIASLQGSRANEILWLVDGVRISNRLYNGATPLDTIPAHMIERIEVLKGGQGIFYGAQSVSGAINVVTKGYSAAADLGVGAGADSNDGRRIDGYARGKAGDASWVAYASYDQADGFQPYHDGDYQSSATDRERGYDVRNVGAKAAWSFNDSLTASLHYQYTDAKLDFANAFLSADVYNARKEHIVSGKLDYAATERFDVYLKGYYHEWATHFTRINNSLAVPGTTAVVSNAEFWGYQDVGFNLMSHYALAQGIDVLAGVDGQAFKGRDEVLLIADKSEQVTALFAQLRIDPERLAHTHAALGVRYSDARDGASATVWNASAQYDVNDALYARALAGASFRLPDAYELYAIDPCCELGNPDLKPESSRNVEVALGGRHAMSDVGLTWEAIAFGRRVSDLIGVGVNAVGDAISINTPGEVEVTGGEVVSRAEFANGVSAGFDYTQTRARQSGVNLQVQRIPEQLAKLHFDYQSGDKRYGVGASAVYVGNLYQNVAAIGRVQHGRYVVADLTGYWHLDAGRQHRFSLRLENAFDREYASSPVRARRDLDNSSYRVDNLGTPRTLHIKYDYRTKG